MSVVASAAQERAQGEQPSRMKSFAAATVAGVAAGVIVYRLLRSA